MNTFKHVRTAKIESKTEILKYFLTKNNIFSPYHAKYFMYYTSPKFYPVQLKSVFSISVENSVDPDMMASERNQLIRISCFKKGFNRTRVNFGISRTRVNSNLTFKWGENLPVYMAIVCHLPLILSGHSIARGNDHD